jgi:nuclease HARBI1
MKEFKLEHILFSGGNNAEVFRNRKGYFSINVQTIADTNLLVRDIVARWPGSVHDTTIFNNCEKRAMFEAGHYGNSILLVDGGYPVRPYLMPPPDRPRTPAEQLYNESQIRTRGCVERQYGVMKRMFPILALSMRVHVANALDIIVACAVVFNLARGNGDMQPPDEIEDIQARIDEDRMPHLDIQGALGARRGGEHVRNMIITVVYIYYISI